MWRTMYYNTFPLRLGVVMYRPGCSNTPKRRMRAIQHRAT